MHRLLPLLAAAAAAALPPSTLLVLRAACLARDPAAFSPSLHARDLRVLPYNDTCGMGWSMAITRASLAAMIRGGPVIAVGWPGAPACDALSAAARALRQPPPVVCALPAARAAAVVRLASRLGWQRALLPPAHPRSECSAALQEVSRALVAAGVATVTVAPRSPDETPLRSHVVILCASREAGVGRNASVALVAGAGAALLLHVEESTDDEDKRTRPDIDPAAPGVSLGDTLTSKFHGASRARRAATRETVALKSPPSTRNSRAKEDDYSRSRGTTESTFHSRRADYIFSSVDRSFPEGDLLLLSGERLDEARTPRDLAQLYAEAFDAVERAADARIEVTDFTFYLYRRSAGGSPAWRLVGGVPTAAARSLDDTQEWVAQVRVDASDALSQLVGGTPAPRGRTGSGAGTAAVSAGVGVGVVLAAVAALAVRWLAARRRRRRRGGDALLSPADFSFPADERRCVGEGMETMLSCWLQQLHEFGGPELERPDLLKQPPRVSSAPSSTCSVNRIALDRRIRYKGDAVHVKPLELGASGCGEGQVEGGGAGGGEALDLKRKALDVLIVMQSLRHENLNPFIGCLNDARPALVWEHCGRGSLEDVLMADDIKLDWTFRLSLLTDLVRGMRYLHASPLRVHGRLSSRNCAVDSRWVLRVTDHGLPALARAQAAAVRMREPLARALLWTAPELLRDAAARARGSQPADVYSFAIIMQEVIVRGEPYCMLALSPEEIVEKLSRPPPLIRPSVSMGAAPPEAVSLMRQCWSEAPDLRPDFHRLHDLFRHLHRGRKINIVDSMFEMLEKYSNNLEELIKERTEQLDMEKKKTEQLLNRMLPRSVAERLLLGSRVEPEEFAEVSIYFSDIVGFTALAARSSPVQVVDLLNDLYTRFDAAIERYRVYKVETIGDAYMVVGGLPARASDHAESVATMALHLLHLAGCFRVRHLPDTPLHLRIGLHSGPCCAGVVGLTMPRYCLFGDTVNTASRMESTGAAWRIQVSAATAERLTAAGGYRLRSRGLVMIKGKGAMHTYWLLGKDGFDRPLPVPPPLESEEVLYEVDGENESESSSGPPYTAAPALATALASEAHERESHLDVVADQREEGVHVWSGAISADSSPPAGARYRRAAGASGERALRRQWSLERGETLAAAAAEHTAERPPPLALLASAAPRVLPPPRYRTRPEEPQRPP